MSMDARVKVAPDQRLGAQVVEMSKLLETLGVWLITWRSQVQILSPQPNILVRTKTCRAPYGAFFAFRILHQRHINTAAEKLHPHAYSGIGRQRRASWCKLTCRF